MTPLKRQEGVMLLEALIGMLIFMLGILGLIGMQAVGSRAVADAKYRAEATMFADQIIGQMSSDAVGNLAADYETGKPKYNEWKAAVTATGTGLPGAGESGNQPTIEYDPATNQVTITIRWRAPGDEAAHSYVTVAQVNAS
jgi:type IV pilus assembly protein PilV